MKLGFTRTDSVSGPKRPEFFSSEKFSTDIEVQFMLVARHAADTGTVVFSETRYETKSAIPVDEWVKQFSQFGLRKVASEYYQNLHCVSFVNDDTFIRHEITENDNGYKGSMATIATTDEALFNAFREMQGWAEKTERIRGTSISVVSRTKPDSPLRTRTVKIPPRALVRENYGPSVIAAWDKVAADLKSDEPNGRLAIFHGPPGTGKTHLIRGFMSAGIEGAFVIIPPKEIANIGDPEMIDLLLEIADDYSGRIVLILEDADEILSSRKATSMSALANALNLGDGLMGEATNAFIVATTNAPLGEIDPAMLRPGRLSVISEVSTLLTSQAQKIYESLGGKGNLSGQSEYTLAEIYAAARKESV